MPIASPMTLGPMNQLTSLTKGPEVRKPPFAPFLFLWLSLQNARKHW
jgi:hypothetical protein